VQKTHSSQRSKEIIVLVIIEIDYNGCVMDGISLA
jgi:hypothetical protein